MYRKIAIALIVVGSLIIGYASFIGSLAQAAPPCVSNSTSMLVNTSLLVNPELAVACRDVIGNETEVPRSIEANVARYSGLAGYFAVVSATDNETEVSRTIEASVAEDIDLAGYFAVVSATGNETEVPRAIEASVAKGTDLAGYFGVVSATDSTYLAANPELLAHNRYALEAQPTQPSSLSSLYAANPELLTVARFAANVESHRKLSPGR